MEITYQMELHSVLYESGNPFDRIPCFDEATRQYRLEPAGGGYIYAKTQPPEEFGRFVLASMQREFHGPFCFSYQKIVKNPITVGVELRRDLRAWLDTVTPGWKIVEAARSPFRDGLRHYVAIEFASDDDIVVFELVKSKFELL